MTELAVTFAVNSTKIEEGVVGCRLPEAEEERTMTISVLICKARKIVSIRSD
jgi:hypothetical protein